VSASGKVLQALDETALTAALEGAFAAGLRACAICLLHGYRYPDHEIAIARIAKQIGFTQLSVSHRESPLMKLVSRADTTVVDAYLSPVLRRYITQVAAALETGDTGTRLMFMQSSGGLAAADRFAGKDAVLSGPAGGVVGMVAAAEAAGFDHLIGFDMGGTSTDVCHYAGRLERTRQAQVAGVHLSAPMMQIHTVAAGGGSLLRYADGRMQVGPSSAGANPGPACYQQGGPLTVTDANVMVGKLQPGSLPPVFGPQGDQPIDPGVVTRLFEPIARLIDLPPPEVADGFLRIAVENMARAIKKVSVEKGYDVSRYTLVSFGGAAGQHACAVADALNMQRIFINPLAGVLSAYGIGRADIRVTRQQTAEEELNEDLVQRLQHDFTHLQQQAESEVLAQGISADAVEYERRVFVKYAETDTPLELAFATLTDLQDNFQKTHAREFGYTQADTPLVIESLLVEAIGGAPHTQVTTLLTKNVDAHPPHPSRFFSGGQWHDCQVYQWAQLFNATTIHGPAIVLERHSTVVIELGWQATMTQQRELILERDTPVDRSTDQITQADPIRLEIFNNLFMSIAEQMGVTLEKTASTINIKERLDFSCGLFDAGGGLVANAPHMPVHLGSMSTSVRTAIKRNPNMQRGDFYVLNDPYNGGTHLPDITVIAPVHLTPAGPPSLYVAARGHHADVGGSSPGSMPADSTTVEQEGVLIDNFLLLRDGQLDEAGVRALLSAGRYPARNPDRNVADLKAQIAACQRGIHQIEAMVRDFGIHVVTAYMNHVQHNAAESVRRVIDQLHDSQFSSTTDQGANISVAIRVDTAQRRAVFDFSASSRQLTSNFNAPAAVTRAAVLYVLRCMVDGDIPLNEGCLDPIDIIIPEGSMLAPSYPAGTVAGNVETSQVIADTLFGALGAIASSQGTMNNLTCGNA
ncbi:MAG: hydantoinase B/oxoprolinase family protein, partial [Gammaproteobacteria bacterium]